MIRRPMLPTFHTKGRPRGDFYVMALAKGLYAPSEKSQCDAFLVLNFSPSKNFTRFSFAIESTDRNLRAYKRGIDENDTMEAAFLTAWYDYEVPVHLWTLYPGKHINAESFGNRQTHHREYFKNREQLCFLLRQFRLSAWYKTDEFAKQINSKFPLKPLFAFKKTPSVPNPRKLNDENKEIADGAFAFFKKRQGKKPFVGNNK
jgi:hypothetical protein